MAQITTQISGKDLIIEQSTNGSTWVDISGMARSVQVSGGTRSNAGSQTATGDTSLLTIGKRDLYTVTVNALYTEASNEAYDEANDAQEGGSAYYLRWFPKGTTASNLKFTTGAGRVIEPLYPNVDASSPDAVSVTIVVAAPTITEGTAT